MKLGITSTRIWLGVAVVAAGILLAACTPVDTAFPAPKSGAPRADGNGTCLRPTVRQVEEARDKPTLLSVVRDGPAEAGTAPGNAAAMRIFDGPHMVASVDWKKQGHWDNQEEVRQAVEDKVQYPIAGSPDLSAELMRRVSSLDPDTIILGYADVTPTDISFEIRCANSSSKYPGVVHTWVNNDFGFIECPNDPNRSSTPNMALAVQAKYCDAPSPTKSQ
jgi:hypothetical protein